MDETPEPTPSLAAPEPGHAGDVPTAAPGPAAFVAAGAWASPDAGAPPSGAPGSGPGADPSTTWLAPEWDGTTEPGYDDADDGTAAELGPAGPRRLPVPLRPMTVSDLLDGGFAIVKVKPGTVLGIAAVAVVPVQLLSAWLSRNVVSAGNLNVLFNGTSTSTSRTTRTSDLDLFAPYVGQALATLAAFFVGVALTKLVTAWYAGGAVSAGQAIGAAARKLPAIVAAWALLLPLKVLSLCFFGVGWFFLDPLFVLTAPAMMAENLGPLAAIKRGLQLTTRRYWPVMWVTTLITVAAYIAEQVLTFIPQILGLALPLPWNWIALGAGRTLIAMLLTPAVTGVAVLLYLDLRVRTEGLDVELEAGEAFAGAA